MAACRICFKSFNVPDEADIPYHLGPALISQHSPMSHNLVLPSNVNAVVKQNFVYRMLFRDIY